jgi:hypothetical protein
MTYELVLVLVPPDDPSPVDRAYALITPFWHHQDKNCCPVGEGAEDEHEDDGEDENSDEAESAPQHYWDYGSTIGWRLQGALWRDRYGEIPADHPINSSLDEVRRAADIDLRALLLDPEALITPDGTCHFMDEPHKGEFASTRKLAEYEDRLAAHPDCLTVPIWCHW